MAGNKEKLIAVAQKLVEKGQLDKAIKEYLKVVSEDANDVRIWLKIGDLYVKLGKSKDAVETYQRVAQFYTDKGHYDKAVAVYKQILKIDPRLVEVNQRLAELFKNLGLLSDAMQQYEAVASFYHKDGKPRDAFAALKQIVELDPDNVASRIKLAELYSKEGMIHEAIGEFSRAAEYLHEQKRFDDYMKVAERLLFHAPDNRSITRQLAKLYIGKGQARRALPKLQVCFKADPRDVETLSLLGHAFEELDQKTKAVSVLRELAQVYGENGSVREREDVFRRILKLKPDFDLREERVGPKPRTIPPATSPAASARLAPVGEVAERRPITPGPSFLEPSVEDSTTTAQAAQEEIGKILTETDVFIKYGLHQKALEHVQKVFALSRNHSVAREKLKSIYVALGRVDDAIAELLELAKQTGGSQSQAYLHEILELKPDHVQARTLLGGAGADPEEAVAPLEPQATAIATPEHALLMQSADPDALPAGGTDRLELFDDIEELSSAELLAIEDESPGEATPAGSGELPLVVDEERVAGGEDRTTGERLFSEFAFPPLDADTGDESTASGQAMRPVGHLTASLEVRPTIELEVSDEAPTPALPFPGAPPETLPDTSPTPSEPFIPPHLEGAASLEDDLDEADFFIQQNLFDEARRILIGLQSRMSGHPLLEAKLRDLRAAEGGAPAAPGSGAAMVASTPEPPAGDAAHKNIIEKGVMPEDFDSHYDLGIAYKEMGLLDEAIAEFNIAMQDPARAVLCHMMIGLSYVEKNALSEAIAAFKAGLYADGIQEREQLSLYYELGQAYEQLADVREALYYYEKVFKRDTSFRDVAERISTLRGGHDDPNLHRTGENEVEPSFDDLAPVARGK